MTPQDELTFADFMSARWSPLFRTAYLLTGKPHRGRGPAPDGTRTDLRPLEGHPRQGGRRRLRAPGDGERRLAPVADERP